MKRKIKRPSVAVMLVLLMFLVGCGGAAAEKFVTVDSGLNTDSGGTAPRTGAAPTTAAISQPPPAAAPAAETPGDQSGTDNSPVVAIVTDPNRKIIKDGTFIIEVKSVQISLSQIGAAAAQTGGYVLETRSDSANTPKQSAVIKIAVPVERFEETLQRVRDSATKVISEQASGQDVSQEFVDAQSQVANLEATQARIREFLAQSKTVEESLKVNAELTTIEGQISQLKGRLQFLTQRTAFSTITVQLQQVVPPKVVAPIVPRIPVLFANNVDWEPGETAEQAFATLSTIGKALGTILIWVSIVVLPLVSPLLLIWLARRWTQRRPARPSSQP